MTQKTSQSISLLIVILIFAGIVLLCSCTSPEETYLLRMKYGPVNKVIHSRQESHKAGSSYKSGNWFKDFETTITGEITIKTIEVFEDKSASIEERHLWSYDEIVDDSGKVKRKNTENSYQIRQTDRDSVLEFGIIEDDQSPRKNKYVGEYFNQMIIYFPEQSVPIGHSWRQESSVVLHDGDTVHSFLKNTIKGLAVKDGKKCLIIESKGNAALPIIQLPDDTLQTRGVDYLEYSSITYFAIEPGMIIQYDEQAHITSVRINHRLNEYYYGEDGEKILIPEEDQKVMDIEMRYEFDQVTNYVITGIDGA